MAVQETLSERLRKQKSGEEEEGGGEAAMKKLLGRCSRQKLIKNKRNKESVVVLALGQADGSM